MPQKIVFAESEIDKAVPGETVTFSSGDLSVPTTPSAAPPQGGSLDAIGRGLASFWEQVNPITMVQGVSQAVTSPIETVKGMGAAQGELYAKAARAFEKGDYLTGARHGLNYLLPIIGPALDVQSDKAATGDIAGSVGGTLGLAANVMAPEGLTSAATMARAVPQKIGQMAQKGATARITDVMAPKVGANKVRFGNVAQKVAPALAKEEGLLAFSREGLFGKVAEKLEEATTHLDEAADARNAHRGFPTQPIIEELLERRRALTAESVEGSQVIPKSKGSVPIGDDVIPAPNRLRVAQIDQAIEEIRQLGSTAHYEALRRIRQAYDAPAKAVYSPTMTADYMTRMGEKLGAADVTGVLRDRLASYDPATAAANARYSLFKNAHDVLQAAEEVDRVRPKVGRQIMTRMLGATAGGASGGLGGAALGIVVAPMVDAALTSGLTTQIATARALSKLAKALEAGNASRAYLAMQDVARLTGQTARVGAVVKSGQSNERRPAP